MATKLYSVVSSYSDPIYGRDVLQSFAQKPLWKQFGWIFAPEQPRGMTLKMAHHPLRKYANRESYSIVSHVDILTEFNSYKNKPK